MFSKKNDVKVLSSGRDELTNTAAAASLLENPSISILGPNTTFQGKLLLKGETHLAGIIEGTIFSEDTLIVETTAQIKGEIHGSFVEIKGTFEGNVSASKMLRLTSEARIEGEIFATKLVIEEGAQIRGKISSSVTTDGAFDRDLEVVEPIPA